MRKLIVPILLTLIVVCPALANPLILTPSGTTLTTGQFRAEAAFSPDDEHGKYFWFATGLMQLEASIIRYEPRGGQAENLINAQWCFIPETFFTPAVSFGAIDIAAESEEGPSGFLAVTKSVPIGRFLPVIQDFKATVGLGVGGMRGPFASFETKLPYGLFMQGEYDTRDFNGAVGWQPAPLFRLKAYSIRAEFYVGAELVPMSF